MTNDVILIRPDGDTATLHEAMAAMFEDAFVSSPWETEALPETNLQVDVIENRQGMHALRLSAPPLRLGARVSGGFLRRVK